MLTGFFNLLLRGVYLVLPGFAAKFLSRGGSFQVLPSFYRVSRDGVPFSLNFCRDCALVSSGSLADWFVVFT